MPLELGFDLACKEYHADAKYRTKRILVFEEEKYSVSKALSDMGFSDCKCHNGDGEELVYELRNWFIELGHKGLALGSTIWENFNFFITNIEENKGLKSKDVAKLSFPEYEKYVTEFLEKRAK